MLNYGYLLTILLLFTLQEINLESLDNNGMTVPSLTLFKDMEGQCNTYCFGIVKPILQQTKQHQFTELQDKIRDLYTVIKNTENQLNAVQIKYGVCEDATKNRETLSREQLNRKVAQLKELQKRADAQEESIKSLENQLSSLQNRIGICEEMVKNREVQYDQLKDLNGSCNNSSRVKDDLIATNKALIDKQQSAFQGEMIKIELKERQITELEDHLKTKLGIVAEQQTKISADALKIKQLNDKIYQYNAQLKKCQSTSCLGKSTNVHVIRVPGVEPFPVFCDSTLADSGWTVILRRHDGSVNFNRNWTAYSLGFGDLRGEFFIGLEKIHLMTKSQHHELYIYLRDFDDENRYAYYDHFQIAQEGEFFRLMSLGDYKGTAGDALSSQRDMKFSTPDRDNDKSPNNCAKEFRAGWWYRKCYYCNLNGQYFNARTTNQYGINWFAWHKNSLQFVQMMIRPKPH
ncbi:fibrinogen-like protein 1 [Drosophila montana]|uniref:fibrinogen-like protein 1 n=1 Tax=Drosophila montana TaxID=40370 RepID=UPI00313D23EF